MADVKISGLPASTTPLAGTEVLPVVQGGQTRQVSIANVTAGRAVSATSYTPTGATVPVNGVYLPATNNVGFATNSLERMRIDSTGNLGIGTTTPQGKLNISAGGNEGIEFYPQFPSVGTNLIQSFNRGGSAYATLQYSALNYTFFTSGTEKMRIHGSGGVSIGNTTDRGAASLNVSGLIYPQQATTAAAPAYVKGAIYFDTTLNKLRVGGATAWETVTSV